MSDYSRMYFDHPVAWSQLKETGRVATLRAGHPTKGDRAPKAVHIYRFGRFTNVTAVRTLVGSVSFDESEGDELLEKWCFASGFSSLMAWKSAALEMSGECRTWKMFMVEVIPEDQVLFGMSEATARELWDNKEDEFWNTV